MLSEYVYASLLEDTGLARTLEATFERDVTRIERDLSLAFERGLASRFSLEHSRNSLESRSQKMYSFRCTVL